MRLSLSQELRHKRTSKKRKALHKVLRSSSCHSFLCAAWETEAHFGGRAQYAGRMLRFPFTSGDSSRVNAYRIHEWELETLVNEWLAAASFSLVNAPLIGQSVDFATLASATNALRALENADYIPGKKDSVTSGIAATFQRQFEWQVHRETTIGLFRNLYIFGSVLDRWFEANRGLSLDKFILSLFGAYALFRESPSFTLPLAPSQQLSDLGLTSESFEKAMSIVALSMINAKKWVAEHRNETGVTAFEPSVLRQFPILFDEDRKRFYCPLRRLLFERMTDGLFYEFQGADDSLLVGTLRNQVGEKFENYCADIFELAGYDINRSSGRKYEFGSKTFEEPDFCLNVGSELIVGECKSKRMSIKTKFNLSDMSEDSGVAEIAKGISQIWRYVSHSRARSSMMGQHVIGVVVTAHEWLMLHPQRRDHVFNRAKEICLEKGLLESKEEMCPVAIVSVQHLEWIVARAEPRNFLQFLKRIANREHSLWAPKSVYQELFPDSKPVRRYPFAAQLGQFLPWWNKLPFEVPGSLID